MRVLVTGATGDVGAHVVSELRRQDVEPRAFVRDAEKGRTLHGDEANVTVGDFGEPETIRRVMDGIDCVFLACANDPRQVEYETNVIDAAVDAGVERIVKLSAHGAEIGSPLEFWDAHGRIEQHLAASGIPGVLLRPTSYMTKILGSPEAIKQTGKLFAPAGDAKLSLIDPRDVAVVATVVLAEDDHEGQTYVLSGPETITFADVAQHLSTATGRTIEFVDVSDEAAREGMLRAGLPEWLVNNLLTLWGLSREGRTAVVTDTVRALTGREPRSFAEYARENAAAF